MTQMKRIYQATQSDYASTNFTQSDGALSTWPTGQTAVTSGSPTTASNQASLPTTAKFGLNHNSSDVFVRAKAVSKAGEAVYVRGDANGYYYAANESTGTTLNYFQISGSVKTVLAGPFTGNAANDILGLEALGTKLTLLRNGRILAQVDALNGVTSKEHGIRNPSGSTVLMDDLIIFPAF
ncbi:MAG: hypothetical protein J0I20_34055 [Chloroflexi bacterium]|nr:hypothetical protein [Chloroflexota bacterium]